MQGVLGKSLDERNTKLTIANIQNFLVNWLPSGELLKTTSLSVYKYVLRVESLPVNNPARCKQDETVASEKKFQKWVLMKSARV